MERLRTPSRHRARWLAAASLALALVLGFAFGPRPGGATTRHAASAGHRARRPSGRSTSSSALPPSPSAAGNGRVSVLHVAGLHGNVREVHVYRPSVPDSATLPVVYFLHGVPGSANDVFGAGIAARLDMAFRNGAAPFVLVSPDGNGASHNDTEWADALDGTDTVESDLVAKIVPAVEGSAPRDRGHRAIAGFSMGGYGAMNIAERHPSMFGQVVSISGYFHVDDPDAMFGNELLAELANQPDQHVAALDHTRVLLLEGSSDAEPVVNGEAARFGALLDSAGIAHTLHVDPGGHHWTFVTSEEPIWTGFLELGWHG